MFTYVFVISKKNNSFLYLSNTVVIINFFTTS